MANETTRVDPLFRNPPCSPSTAMAAAARVLEKFELSATSPLALAVVDGRGRVLAQAAAPADEPLVIGRHERCGLQVDDPSVALRQLLIAPASASTGVETTLWDLRTDFPLMTGRRELATCIVARGSFAVTFGSFTVVGLAHATLEHGAKPLLWAHRATPQSGRAALPPHRPGETTVTRVKPLGYLGEASIGGIVCGHLEVSREGGGVRSRLAVTASDLRDGILIGRYERCNLRSLDCGELSRVHALIVQRPVRPRTGPLDPHVSSLREESEEGGGLGSSAKEYEVRVFDLASTNGTTVDGREVRVGTLGEASVLGCGGLELRYVALRRAVA